jgi:hypothetical protein
MIQQSKRTILILAILAFSTLGFVIWNMGHISSKQTPRSASTLGELVIPQNQAGTDSINAGISANAPDKSVGAENIDVKSNLQSLDAAQLGITSAPKGLFRESITNLLNSRDLKKVDYARLKILAPCGNQMWLGKDRRQAAFSTQLQVSAALDNTQFRFQRAPEQTRRAALEKFVEVCQNIFESKDYPAKISDSAMNSAQSVELRRILAAADVLKLNSGAPEADKAFKVILSTPLYGALENNLYSSLDYARLQNDYSPEQIALFNIVVVPILLCRMGDDCGPNGTVTLQICMQVGICGNYVEEAVWDSLKNSKFDTTALKRFIDYTYLALQAQELSVFKR